MSLPIDLKMLKSGNEFQSLCFQLVRKDYQYFSKMMLLHHYDGGRDIIGLNPEEGLVVFQCKFTEGKLAALKPRIIESLNALRRDGEISKWILCISVNITGTFYDWLKAKVNEFPFIRDFEVWDREVILAKLEDNAPVLQKFFYPIWKQMELIFQTEELELVRYDPYPDCNWKCVDDDNSLSQPRNIENGDLVLDIILRNRGSLQLLVESIDTELRDVSRFMHGLPGEGLLFPQFEHVVSLQFGHAFQENVRLEPPLVLNPGSHERFSIRFCDTGYAWSGYLGITLHYGKDKVFELRYLPTISRHIVFMNLRPSLNLSQAC